MNPRRNNMKKRWMRVGMVMAMVAALMSTGCWGLVLYGRPGPGRNQGPVDWGVVILDLVFLGLIGIGIDACAGTLRRPEYAPSCWGDNGTPSDKAKGLVVLRDTIKVNIRPEDVKRNGDRDLAIVWVDVNGVDRELYSGKVKDACGIEIPTKDLSGVGRLEVRLDGRCALAWDARVVGARTQFAAK
jgi:hypothetical protein